MISNNLFEPSDFDERSITPKPEHVVPDSIEFGRTREAFRAQLANDPEAVIVTHTDADGYSSAALIAHIEHPETPVRPVDYHGAYGLEDALEDIASCAPRTRVYILDLNPDSAGIKQPLINLWAADCPVTWYDHHQWDDDVREAVESAGVDLVVDEDECTASLISREFAAYAEKLEDLAECTKDIDLWVRDDPRSERLNVFATIADVDEYIEAVLWHGADLPGEIEQRIDERLDRDRELEEAAVDRAVIRMAEEYRVAFTYSRGGRSSVIGNTLVEEMDNDIAVVMKSHGGVGIYSHSNRETFAQCHQIAERLGGGGHPTAAGCSVPVQTFREMAEYWSTAGESIEDRLYEAVDHVAYWEGSEVAADD